MMHRPRRIALHPVLLPGACCVRGGEASLPLAPLPVPRIPGPAEGVGAASLAAVTGEQGPRLPGPPPPALRVGGGGWAGGNSLVISTPHSYLPHCLGVRKNTCPSVTLGSNC